MNKNQVSIGIPALSYRLPGTKKSVGELEQEKRINSPASLLLDFGFSECYIQDSDKGFENLLLESGKEVLDKSSLAKDDVTRLFLYSGINNDIEDKDNENALNLFRYPVAELRHKLGLSRANAIGVSQQGCSGLLSSIYLASQLLASSESQQESMLCMTADRLPHGTKREIMYNIMSDATAAVLITKNSDENQIIHFHQEVQSYYWDTPQHENELLASYFPMAQRTIENAVKGAGLSMSDIKWFVPHNVSLRSWEILAKLLHIPMEKIWTKNIARVGHTVSSDHIINLVDMDREGALTKGDYLALFTFGFGANWSCLILKH